MGHSDTEIFKPRLKQKLIWGWGSAAGFLFSLYTFAVVFEMDPLAVISMAPWTITCIFFYLRYVIAGYRAEISGNVLKVVSPFHFSREISLDQVTMIGGKGPEHERFSLRTDERFFNFPNYVSAGGVSLMEEVNYRCDIDSTHQQTYSGPQTVDVSRAAPAIQKRSNINKIAAIALLCVTLSLVGWLTIKGYPIIAVPLVISYLILWKLFSARLSFVVEDDGLIVTRGKTATRYDASDIIDVTTARTQNSIITRVEFRDGNAVGFFGNHEPEIGVLLNRPKKDSRLSFIKKGDED